MSGMPPPGQPHPPSTAASISMTPATTISSVLTLAVYQPLVLPLTLPYRSLKPSPDLFGTAPEAIGGQTLSLPAIRAWHPLHPSRRAPTSSARLPNQTMPTMSLRCQNPPPTLLLSPLRLTLSTLHPPLRSEMAGMPPPGQPHPPSTAASISMTPATTISSVLTLAVYQPLVLPLTLPYRSLKPSPDLFGTAPEAIGGQTLSLPAIRAWHPLHPSRRAPTSSARLPNQTMPTMSLRCQNPPPT